MRLPQLLVYFDTSPALRLLKSARVMDVPVRLGAHFTAGAPRELFAAQYVDFFGLNYDVTPDGKRFLMVKEAPQTYAKRGASDSGLVVVLNWLADLKAQPK